MKALIVFVVVLVSQARGVIFDNMERSSVNILEENISPDLGSDVNRSRNLLDDTRLVTDGYSAFLGQFPYHAQAQIKLRYLGNLFRCEGALITPNYILTSAFCLHEVFSRDHSYGVDFAFVTLGNAQRFDFTESTIKMHPFFNYPGLWEGVTYNIATIRLPFSATLNDYVQPIRLPRLSDTRTYEKMEGTVTTGDYQYGLYYLRNQVMSNADCQRDILHHLIPDQQMCTDTYIGGAFNSRRYGAPLTIEDGNGRVLVGLADFWKWTPNSYPTRFVRVAYFRDWIQTNTDYIFQF